MTWDEPNSDPLADIREVCEKVKEDVGRPPPPVVQCRCGRLKQEGFICDFCFSVGSR